MNVIKRYFATWDFSRYFRLTMGVLLLIGFVSTKENMYLVGSIFLSLQAILNFGCPGGTCSTSVPDRKENETMKFEKYEPSKNNKNV